MSVTWQSHTLRTPRTSRALTITLYILIFYAFVFALLEGGWLIELLTTPAPIISQQPIIVVSPPPLRGSRISYGLYCGDHVEQPLVEEQ